MIRNALKCHKKTQLFSHIPHNCYLYPMAINNNHSLTQTYIHKSHFSHTFQSHSKKRSAPQSILSDTSIPPTPAKKNRTNNANDGESLNCLANLESEARQKLCALVKEGIESIYDISFDDNQSAQYLLAQMSRNTHGRGEITLPCFKLCKVLNSKNAMQIAEKLSDFINESIRTNNGVLFLSNPFSKVCAEKGRINAYLTVQYLAQIIPLINSHSSFLSQMPRNNETVMVEYSQPNTHKAFHVGHMRNVALGDCIVRLYEHCGYKTIAANYFGDEGAHVAKCVWLLQKEIEEGKLDLDAIENNENLNKGEWLGNKYAEACKLLTLSTYTKFPFIGVVVGKILSKEVHKSNPKWHVCTVEYGNSKRATVVCGGTEYGINDLIAYIPLGSAYKDKIAEKKEFKGVMSEGVIMGANECGVALPPLPTKKTEESKENTESKTEPKKGKKKQKNKKSKKKKVIKDDRIFLVSNFYKNAKIGDKLTEIGKYESYAHISDIESWHASCVKQQKTVLKLLESKDETYVNLWQRTREWSLSEFARIYEWLNARFDYDFFESECSEESRALVFEYLRQGIFVKSEGAIGIDLKEEKLGFCLLLKSNGSGLYATKDLALAQKKFDLFGVNESIYVVDSSQNFHFKQVFACLSRMGYAQSEKCSHLSYAFVRLAQGKMATRTGNVILFSELVRLLATEVNSQYLNDKRESNEWSESELSEAERAISAGAIRYGMLNHDNNKEIVFDLKQWTLSSGNTGPYLMYAYARIASINRKIDFDWESFFEESKTSENSLLDYSVLESGEDSSGVSKQILFELCLFQTKVNEITVHKSPSQLCDYLYGICKLFSQWYSLKENSILHCSDPHLKAVRLRFCDSVAKTIKTGMELLGITPLERM